MSYLKISKNYAFSASTKIKHNYIIVLKAKNTS